MSGEVEVEITTQEGPVTIAIDPERCCGYGECAMTAPEVYALGIDGVATARQPEDGTPLDRVQAGADACPVAAITITITTGPVDGPGGTK